MPFRIDWQGIQYVWPFLLAAVVLLGLGMRWLLRQRRSRALSEAAMTLGFTSDPGPVNLPEMRLFGQGDSSDQRNVLRGAAAGLETVLFDYSYTVGSGKSRHTVAQTVAAFHRPGANMPDFQIAPRNFFRSLATKFGEKKEARFENNPQFSRQYVVTGADHVSAATMFTPGILSFLEGRAENPFTIEGYFDWIIVYRPGKTVRVARFPWFIEETSTLANGILTQVRRPLLNV